MVPLSKTLKKKALEVLQTELAKKRLMRLVPDKHMLRTVVLSVEFFGPVRWWNSADGDRGAKGPEAGQHD